MKAYRNVAIVSGKNAIAVKVCGMLDKAESIFSNTCPNCEGSVGYQNICQGECGEVIPFASIKKGYTKMVDGVETKVVFDKSQIDQLKSIEQAIKVVGAMPIKDIDIRTIGEGYYVLPRKLDPKKKNSPNSTQPYCAFVKALEASGKVVQIKYTLSGKEKQGILVVHNGLIVLKNVVYDEQLRDCDETPEATLTPVHLKKAKNFITALKQIDFKKVENEYTKAIEELLAGKIPKLVQRQESDGMDFFD
jgi:non-homologous end joining protein Ku